MLFYIDDENEFDNIPDSYKIIVISNSRLLVNKPNSIEFNMYVPDFKFSDKEIVNKKKYINQIKEREKYLVSLFYSNKVADIENGFKSNIVFVCDSHDIEDFNYMKLFRKFIRKKYGIKVYHLTYDITLDMLEESKMDISGQERYLNKLMDLGEEIDRKL